VLLLEVNVVAVPTTDGPEELVFPGVAATILKDC
jgi:hypothetical protein